MAFSCILIEQNPAVLQKMKGLIFETPFLQLVKTYHCPNKALNDVRTLKKPLDILFSEINFTGNGELDFAHQMGPHFQSVLLKTFHGYNSTFGYNLNKKKFLIKSMTLQEFRDFVNPTDKPFSYVSVKCSLKKKTQWVDVNDIIQIRGASNYVQIITLTQEFLVYGKLRDFETLLLKWPQFVRIKKSNIISTKQITKLLKTDIYLADGSVVTAGRTFLRKFRNIRL